MLPNDCATGFLGTEAVSTDSLPIVCPENAQKEDYAILFILQMFDRDNPCYPIM